MENINNKRMDWLTIPNVDMSWVNNRYHRRSSSVSMRTESHHAMDSIEVNHALHCSRLYAYEILGAVRRAIRQRVRNVP
jgi:hypothetical protein